jgi:hypothetical protein
MKLFDLITGRSERKKGVAQDDICHMMDGGFAGSPDSRFIYDPYLFNAWVF